MIKAGAISGDGTPLLILGLSRKNCELLLEGNPIPVECEPIVGMKLRVLIIAGETEGVMEAQLRRFTDASTRVVGTPPSAKGRN